MIDPSVFDELSWRRISRALEAGNLKGLQDMEIKYCLQEINNRLRDEAQSSSNLGLGLKMLKSLSPQTRWQVLDSTVLVGAGAAGSYYLSTQGIGTLLAACPLAGAVALAAGLNAGANDPHCYDEAAYRLGRATKKTTSFLRKMCPWNWRKSPEEVKAEVLQAEDQINQAAALVDLLPEDQQEGMKDILKQAQELADLCKQAVAPSTSVIPDPTPEKV